MNTQLVRSGGAFPIIPATTEVFDEGPQMQGQPWQLGDILSQKAGDIGQW